MRKARLLVRLVIATVWVTTAPTAHAQNAASRAATQTAAAQVTMVGLAWDSLSNAPLEGAFVTVAGSGRSARGRAMGVVHVDSIAHGGSVFMLDHAVLHSVGISGMPVRVTVREGVDTVRLSVPSFASFWRAACGGAVPADSGLLFGTVRDADRGRPVVGATVRASWLDIAYQKGAGLSQQRLGGDVRADSAGGYAICGTPPGMTLRVRATTDSAASGEVDLFPTARRVLRRDLSVGAYTAGGPALGTLTGVVLDGAGAPLGGARVTVDGVPSVTSGADGRFSLRDVPAGTRQVTAIAIGMLPLELTADVRMRDTAEVILSFQRVTTLAAVRVVTNKVRLYRAMGFDERRSLGLGSFMDSTSIVRFGTMSSVWSQLGASRVRVRGRRIQIEVRGCRPVAYIDGLRSRDPESDLGELFQDQLAAIEMYRGQTSPMEFDGGTCGSIVVWTKRSFP